MAEHLTPIFTARGSGKKMDESRLREEAWKQEFKLNY